MIDIYEKSGDAARRLLVRQNQPLPDFADAAEWSHVGARETVGADLGSVLQNQGYAVVTGNTDYPLETDWEGLFGGSAEPAPAEPQTGVRSPASTEGSGSAGPAPLALAAETPALQETIAAPVLASARAAVSRIGVPGLEALEQRVRDKPAQTLAWTLGIGFLLGILP